MTLALTGGKIGELHNATVLIEGESIVAVGDVPIPEDAEVVDCRGLTITAGFWNSHVHFFERKWANAAEIPEPELSRQFRETFTQYGFTSVFDLGSLWENTRQFRGRELNIRSTGEGLIAPGAAPPDIVLRMMGVMKTPLPEVANATEAIAVVRRLIDEGVDGIKLFLPVPEGVLDAAVNEAHRASKPVFVHPNSTADVNEAIRAGVDVIAHTTPHSDLWTQCGNALTPTLSLWKHFARHDRISTQDRIVEASIAQLRTWRELGGKVLFGTDLGAVDPNPAEEYALMSRAGMSLAEILASLTTTPAAMFGEAHRRGRVAPGYQADLAVWKTLTDVRYTLRGGVKLGSDPNLTT